MKPINLTRNMSVDADAADADAARPLPFAAPLTLPAPVTAILSLGLGWSLCWYGFKAYDYANTEWREYRKYLVEKEVALTLSQTPLATKPGGEATLLAAAMTRPQIERALVISINQLDQCRESKEAARTILSE